ncbi:unnamed protein product, partial [Closterium sp. NIES-53]
HVHIVTELLAGGDLFDRIRSLRRLSEPSAARLCAALIEALLHCHCRGIAHRDIKPENILLTSLSSDSDIKLIDFGVATSFQRGVPLTDAVGTPEYMAPEVLRQSYGPEADIWSAGVVLYVVLSGAPPFWGSKSKSVVERILKKEVAFRGAKWEGVSEEAKDLVARMLVKDSTKRIGALEILEHPWIQKWKQAPRT